MLPAIATYLATKQQQPSDQTPRKDSSMKETVLYGLLGLAAAGGLFFLGRKVYHTLVSGAEERKSMDTDSAAAFAKRIRMAFDNDGWWGTDEDVLRQVLREIESQSQWVEIGRSYQRLYSSPLMRDMQDELTSTEYSEMTAIIASKPSRQGETVVSSIQLENWARRLKAAFDISYWMFPGTDEEAVKAVFTEIPSQGVFLQVAEAYARMYGSNLTEDLKSDMWDYKDYLAIITSKP